MAMNSTIQIVLGAALVASVGFLVFWSGGGAQEGVLEYVYVEKVVEDPGAFQGRTFKVHGIVVEGTVRQKKNRNPL